MTDAGRVEELAKRLEHGVMLHLPADGEACKCGSRVREAATLLRSLSSQLEGARRERDRLAEMFVDNIVMARVEVLEAALRDRGCVYGGEANIAPCGCSTCRALSHTETHATESEES